MRGERGEERGEREKRRRERDEGCGMRGKGCEMGGWRVEGEGPRVAEGWRRGGGGLEAGPAQGVCELCDRTGPHLRGGPAPPSKGALRLRAF